ncbi:MAG: hypothetical protein JSW71_02745, partial [Gemmatimonadota bacterium]
MDEKSQQGSWGSGLPVRGADRARFESQVPEDDRAAPQQGSNADSSTTDSFSADIVFIVKQDGVVLYLNRTLSDRPEGAAGSSLLDYTDEAYHEDVRRSLDLVFSSGTPHGYECQGSEPFRKGARYQCRVAPNRREGRVVSATIIARDVASWKDAEQALQQERDPLGEEYQRAAAELKRLRGELVRGEDMQEELERFEQERDRLQTEYDSAASQLQRLRDELAGDDDRHGGEDGYEQERDQLRRDYQRVASDLERLRARLAEGEGLRQEFDRFRREREQLQRDYEAAADALERLRDERQGPEDRGGEADRFRQERDALKGEHDRVAAELERLRAELEQRERRHQEADRFRQERDELKDRHERAASELE